MSDDERDYFGSILVLLILFAAALGCAEALVRWSA